MQTHLQTYHMFLRHCNPLHGREAPAGGGHVLVQRVRRGDVPAGARAAVHAAARLHRRRVPPQQDRGATALADQGLSLPEVSRAENSRACE